MPRTGRVDQGFFQASEHLASLLQQMKMYENNNIMKSKFQNIRLVDANENPRSPAASGHKYCSADVSRIEPRREARCGAEPMQSAVQAIIELLLAAMFLLFFSFHDVGSFDLEAGEAAL